ncbi:mycofactocin-coupled SDR family oxidoreductase [Pseudonocardia spinosispora]|uniref:mycofactocin-coupled SDR family oxidoreductase n=1 Tax=Pseudonocardia spinosispora TaxID=103441 RepID=UPI00041804C6|nr:mycofactocin-coupled SDR family oxidoreductase [Pseudonocardia spinosispora]
MGRVEGKVALITGAARGQGRSHALRLAEEGAEIVAIDICSDLDTVPYPGATSDDLATTTRMVEDLDRRIIARQADVRDSAALKAVVDEAVAEFGHIDIVCANAGIASFAPSWEITDEVWQEMLDVNLTGVWKTTKAVIPQMIEQGTGGSIVLTSSTAGLVAFGNLAHYTAAKHGVVGLMKVLAVELAQHRIRVNTVHPTTVDTPMIDNPAVRSLFVPQVQNPSKEQARELMKAMNALPIPWVESVDISNAVLFLASDEGRYVTGVQLPIEAGGTMPYKYPNV